MVRNALRFVLAQDVSVVAPGFRSIGEVETAAKVGEDYRGLTKEEEKRFGDRLESNYCRDCGLCMPCPQNLDIAAVLRFHTLFDNYGLIDWSRKLYKGLEVGVEKCTKCGECEPRCPYRLPIVKKLQKAQKNLQY
jgi:predicted aldo/keto reductase-like oxidoreductase